MSFIWVRYRKAPTYIDISMYLNRGSVGSKHLLKFNLSKIYKYIKLIKFDTCIFDGSKNRILSIKYFFRTLLYYSPTDRSK